MADELQALLDKITEDELKKADEEKGKILAQAKAEADETVRQAKAEAAAIVEAAKKEASMLHQKGEEALKQASRDVLLSLRAELEKRVSQAAESMMKSSMEPKALADIIAKLIAGFIQNDGKTDDIKILLNHDDIATVEEALKAQLGKELQANVTLAPSPAVAGGFKLLFKQSGIVYDFSDKALAETVAAGLGPKLAAIITD